MPSPNESLTSPSPPDKGTEASVRATNAAHDQEMQRTFNSHDGDVWDPKAIDAFLKEKGLGNVTAGERSTPMSSGKAQQKLEAKDPQAGR